MGSEDPFFTLFSSTLSRDAPRWRAGGRMSTPGVLLAEDDGLGEIDAGTML